MSEVEASKPLPVATEDARALLARLYREIGVSAVAAALQLGDLPAPAPRKPATEHPAPAVATGDTLAA
jgi:hypothetical protein